MTSKQQTLGLVGWLVVCFLAAGVGAVASVNAKEFYGGLVQPSWAPPPWLFGPVWTVLYAMMAVAAWLVWRDGGFARRSGVLTLFLVQLALNAGWTWLFFSLHNGLAALVEIVVLWALIVATVVGFWRVHRVAGALLVPYLAWVSFATVLTYTMWRLNPQILG